MKIIVGSQLKYDCDDQNKRTKNELEERCSPVCIKVKNDNVLKTEKGHSGRLWRSLCMGRFDHILTGFYACKPFFIPS